MRMQDLNRGECTRLSMGMRRVARTGDSGGRFTDAEEVMHVDGQKVMTALFRVVVKRIQCAGQVEKA